MERGFSCATPANHLHDDQHDYYNDYYYDNRLHYPDYADHFTRSDRHRLSFGTTGEYSANRYRS